MMSRRTYPFFEETAVALDNKVHGAVKLRRLDRTIGVLLAMYNLGAADRLAQLREDLKEARPTVDHALAKLNEELS